MPLRIRRLNRKISVFICVTAYTEGANQLRRTLEAVAESLYERANRPHTVMCEWQDSHTFYPILNVQQIAQGQQWNPVARSRCGCHP